MTFCARLSAIGCFWTQLVSILVVNLLISTRVVYRFMRHGKVFIAVTRGFGANLKSCAMDGAKVAVSMRLRAVCRPVDGLLVRVVLRPVLSSMSAFYVSDRVQSSLNECGRHVTLRFCSIGRAMSWYNCEVAHFHRELGKATILQSSQYGTRRAFLTKNLRKRGRLPAPKRTSNSIIADSPGASTSADSHALSKTRTTSGVRRTTIPKRYACALDEPPVAVPATCSCTALGRSLCTTVRCSEL